MISRKGLIAYLIFLHLLLGLVLLKSDFPQRMRTYLSGLSPELTAHYHNMVAYHRRMDSQVPEGAVIFIGDSLTQSLAVANVSPVAVNYGIGSDTTVGVLHRLDVYASLDRADTIVMAIGLNDLKRRDAVSILDNSAHILGRLPKQARVVISALLPVDEEILGGTGTNRQIRRINQGLQRLADEDKQWVYCDIGAKLSVDDGNLKPAYHTGDGIHLNAMGYAVWTEALKTSIESLQRSSE